MAKAVFWKSDWFLGVFVTLLMLTAVRANLLQGLERQAYDFGMQAASRVPSERIAVIAIDDRSIAQLGPWPWSRQLHARLTDRLAGAPAKVIANTVLFSEAPLDPGYAYITKLIDIVNQAVAEGAGLGPEIPKITAVLAEAETALNSDRQLADSYARAGNIVLPVSFELGEVPGHSAQRSPELLTAHRLPQVAEGRGRALSAVQVQLPLAVLGGKALALGFLNRTPDADGGVRSEPLVVQYFDQFYPALSLMIVASSLDLGPADIQVRLGEAVRLGKLRIATDASTRMNTFFYRTSDGRPAFPVDSFADVLTGKIPASKYAGKIVLVGVTATGLAAPQATPVAPAMAPVLGVAHAVSSILQEHFFVTPSWGVWASLAALLVVGSYLIFPLPRLAGWQGALATLLLLLILVGSHFLLMLGVGMWIPLMGAASLLVVGHLLLIAKHFLLGERPAEKSAFASAEANRMLGLAFQGQGQLDMAFEKFRKCPFDDGLMENMYNLALDYERQRQFAKAETVFRTMAEHNPTFRDIQTRLGRARQGSAMVPLADDDSPIIDGGQLDKPMLGRYELEKELGKGAMGVVYQGRDPQINRVVAIKTMALAQEFDEDELTDVKLRFFREAETAGRLSHPNIVTMYDAGEAHDLAYIAMEFLQGRDLVAQTKPGALLPLSTVLSIIARVADALDYAHGQQVVHRDIKPANIMYEAASDQVKVTDFGIARITDSSRTKTGMVLGTPSYMSPEQLAGKKIDGRSDLFSLGVTLYQMTCGQLPFVGESLAQLMYKITNEAPTDILSIDPALPSCVVAVIDRALNKNVAERYQRGAEMAADLRACIDQLAAQAA
jgi:serine/threonine-protein kinase